VDVPDFPRPPLMSSRLAGPPQATRASKK
jgi:hypothetical protein